jgi:hypothetical protein
LALPIFFVAALMSGRTNLAKRMQANAEFWMNFNLTLALVMVLLGGFLRFVPRQLKPAAGPQAAAVASSDQIASQKLPFEAGRE